MLLHNELVDSSEHVKIVTCVKVRILISTKYILLLLLEIKSLLTDKRLLL